MNINHEKFKATYNLAKEVDALQAAIEVYGDNEETLETALTLLDLLMERTRQALMNFTDYKAVLETARKEALENV